MTIKGGAGSEGSRSGKSNACEFKFATEQSQAFPRHDRNIWQGLTCCWSFHVPIGAGTCCRNLDLADTHNLTGHVEALPGAIPSLASSASPVPPFLGEPSP